jgi:aspartate/methionine/tyrosine aminotransferase
VAPSIATAPDLEDRWVIVNGVAKSYAMTGWRVGWLVGPSDVVKAADKHQSHLTSNINNVAQRAALAGLAGPEEPLEEMRQAFDRRRRMMHSALGKMPGVTCVEPFGAFYCFPGFIAHMPRFGSALELAGWLLEEADVAVVPGEAFGTPGFARFSYALGEADLEIGLERVSAAFESVTN